MPNVYAMCIYSNWASILHTTVNGWVYLVSVAEIAKIENCHMEDYDSLFSCVWIDNVKKRGSILQRDYIVLDCEKKN